MNHQKWHEYVFPLFVSRQGGYTGPNWDESLVDYLTQKCRLCGQVWVKRTETNLDLNIKKISIAYEENTK